VKLQDGTKVRVPMNSVKMIKAWNITIGLKDRKNWGRCYLL
jgi:hypothetical protein